MIQSRPKDVQLHFITSTASIDERKIDDVSRQLIRSIAGKHGKILTPLAGHGKQRNTTVQEYQAVKGAYTSKIKLKSWTRKSGRQKRTSITDNNTLEKEVKDARVENQIFLLRELEASNPLPISFFPGTAELMSFWHGGFITNAGALNPEGDWYECIRDDPAALHAMISVVGRIQTLLLARKEDALVLKHEAEAVQSINYRLIEEQGLLSNGLIAAAAVLVNQEALGDSFERARIHMEGLARMIVARGGLENMDCRMTLQRIITYGDFCFSSAWGQPPRFPLVLSLLNARELEGSNHFLDLRLKSAQTRGPHTIDPYGDVFDALELLHSITRHIAASLNEKHQRITLANSIYLAEYMLCRMNSSPISDVEPRCLDISAPLAAAAHLFLHLGVRNIPSNAGRHRYLTQRLHIALPHDLDYESLVDVPRAGVRLLLWVCSIGAVREEDDVNTRDMRLVQLRQLCGVLEVRSFEEFKQCLKEVLWIDPFSSEHMSRIWQLVQASFLLPGIPRWENDILEWGLLSIDEDFQ